MPEPWSEQNVLHTWERQLCERIVPLLVALGVQRLHPGQMGRIDRTAELPHTWALGWKSGKTVLTEEACPERHATATGNLEAACAELAARDAPHKAPRRDEDA